MGVLRWHIIMGTSKSRSRPQRSKRRQSKSQQTKNQQTPRWQPKHTIAVGLFVLALALRMLFWQATADSSWPYSAYYKGDAATWLDYARALHHDQPFELDIPLRPPATGYLISWLWDGQPRGIAGLRLLWCLMGALIAPLIFVAARRPFGEPVALLTGLLCAGSTGLMILSTSLDNETPYLLLVVGTFILWQSLRQRPTTQLLAGWSLLNGLACLTRVEHALYFVLATAFLILAWRRAGSSRLWPRLATLGAVFGLVLLPWHLEAWREIRRFNNEEPNPNPATEAAWRQVEAALEPLAWDDGAIAERERLPAFIRRTASNFVAATVLVRGGREVTGNDFEILEEAFGYHPEAVASTPFVALYGGLNFYLANNSQATGGFDRSILEAPPPLVGGASRFPSPLIAGLPPPDLTLTYPAHLRIVNQGYALGARWIWQNPADFARLAVAKLRLFWRGATLGFGGYNMPLGLSGVRRPVDLVVPQESLGTRLWELTLLLAAIAGLGAGLRRATEAERTSAHGDTDASSPNQLAPWLCFGLSKVVAVVLFFGYARQGATTFPVLALLLAFSVVAVAHRFGASRPDSAPARRRWRTAVVAGALALIAIEGARTLSQPAITIDGLVAGSRDPWPVDRHAQRQLDISE